LADRVKARVLAEGYPISYVAKVFAANSANEYLSGAVSMGAILMEVDDSEDEAFEELEQDIEQQHQEESQPNPGSFDMQELVRNCPPGATLGWMPGQGYCYYFPEQAALAPAAAPVAVPHQPAPFESTATAGPQIMTLENGQTVVVEEEWDDEPVYFNQPAQTQQPAPPQQPVHGAERADCELFFRSAFDFCFKVIH
jgi:hypothetical protein